MDQFGNLVKVQGLAENLESCYVFVPAIERSTASNPSYPPTMDALHSNPLIKQMVEEQMAVLEAKMSLRYKEVCRDNARVAGTMCQTLHILLCI